VLIGAYLRPLGVSYVPYAATSTPIAKSPLALRWQ